MNNRRHKSVASLRQDLPSQTTQPAASDNTPGDMTDDPQYQQFVESMVPHCHCAAQHKPCDGVLAGGICDHIQDDLVDDDRVSLPYDDDERRWNEDPMQLGGI